MIIADVGRGVGWTSAIMAKHPRVKKYIWLNQILIVETVSKMFVTI